MDIDTIKVVIAAASAVATALMVVAVFFQIRIANKTLLADHERRRKQATVEFVSKLRESSWPLEVELRREFQDEVINISGINPEREVTVGRFLSLVEQLSTGVNVGVFDFDVLARLMGNHLITMHDKLGPYIKMKREKIPTYSNEYSALTRRLESERIPTSAKGTIIHTPLRKQIEGSIGEPIVGPTGSKVAGKIRR